MKNKDNKEEKQEEVKEEVKEEIKEEKIEKFDVLEKAEKLSQDLNEKITTAQELIKKQELLEAKRALGGTALAGEIIKPESEDEKWAREAKIRYAGTGMDPT